MSMTAKNQTAWYEFYHAIKSVQEVIAKAKKGGRPQVEAKGKDLRALISKLFEAYLQERLCKAAPDKFVPHVGYFDGVKFYEAVKGLVDKEGVKVLADDERMMSLLTTFIQQS